MTSAALTLCCISNLEAIWPALTSVRPKSPQGLNAIHRVDATARRCLRILEIEPSDRLRSASSSAGVAGCIHLFHLADLSHWVRFLDKLIKSKHRSA